MKVRRNLKNATFLLAILISGFAFACKQGGKEERIKKTSSKAAHSESDESKKRLDADAAKAECDKEKLGEKDHDHDLRLDGNEGDKTEEVIPTTKDCVKTDKKSGHEVEDHDEKEEDHGHD